MFKTPTVCLENVNGIKNLWSFLSTIIIGDVVKHELCLYLFRNSLLARIVVLFSQTFHLNQGMSELVSE